MKVQLVTGNFALTYTPFHRGKLIKSGKCRIVNFLNKKEFTKNRYLKIDTEAFILM